MARRILRIVLVLVLLVISAETARLFVWPDLPRPPARVDAIVELGGPGHPERDDTTFALARAHRAPVLVRSLPREARRCKSPVPEVVTLCFHPDPNTTQGEARWIGQEAQRRHWRSIIIVTSRDHAWRARLVIGRCFPGEIYVNTSPLPFYFWPRQIPYQWGATVKSLVFTREC
jgi:uncharacterized SAM-binding protein YcdF (DUF218 family)